MANNDASRFPGVTQEQLELARHHGYTDAQIQRYLGERYATGAFEHPPSQHAESLIDRTKGEDFLGRMLASFKSSPQERVAFWKKYRGDQNVTVTPAGEILIRSGKGWKPIDESGMSFADLADFAGDVPELAAMLVTKNPGGFLAKVAASAGKTALGNIAKQTIGAMLPGESTRGAGERVGEVAKAGAGGGVAQALGGALTSGLLPHEMPAEFVNKLLRDRLGKLRQGDIAQEGSRLVKSTGFPLDIAEETQDPLVKMMAGFAYRNAFGQTQLALNQKAKDSAALSMLQRLSGELGKEGGFESRPLGQAAAQAAGRSLQDVQSGLKSASEQYFSFLKGAMGERQIPVSKYREKLLEQAKYYRSMETSTGRELADELEGAANDMNLQPAMNEVSHQPGTLNARAIQEHLQNLGEATWGKEGPKFFANMRKYGKSKELKDLHSSLREDLIAAEEGGGKARPPARALRQAREAWDQEQDTLRQLKDLPLLKFMESKGMLTKDLEDGVVGHEHVAKSLIEGMKSGKISPSEITNMTDMLTAVNSDFPHTLASGLLDSAVQAGKAAGKGRPSQFSYQEAYNALPSPEHLQAIYQNVWNPQHKTTGMRVSADIKDLMSAIERSSTPGQGIPQSPGSTLINIGAQTMYGDAKAAAKNLVSHVLLPKKIAAFVSDPAMRDAMLKELEAGEASGGQGFLPQWAKQSLPPLLYEGGSAVQRQNQPQTGYDPAQELQ